MEEQAQTQTDPSHSESDEPTVLSDATLADDKEESVTVDEESVTVDEGADAITTDDMKHVVTLLRADASPGSLRIANAFDREIESRISDETSGDRDGESSEDEAP